MHRSVRSSLALPLCLVALAGAGLRPAAAQRDRTVSIPADTIVRLRLEDRLSSRTNRVGDTFAATLDEKDTSGFPTGTRFQGEVTEVQRFEKDQPGVVDVRLRRAFLPDGQKVDVEGRLASLADDDVRRTSDGRVEARRRGGGRSNPDWKWAGYGAAGGAVLGAILGGSWIKGAVLGGLGGAVYGYLNRGSKGSKDFRDVDLPRGTEFGMSLERRIAFDDRAAYRYTASRNLREDNGASREEERVAGRREEFRYGSTVVRLNGRDVSLEDSRPMNINGTLYVPLRPIAAAANMRVRHRFGQDSFGLDTARGQVRGYAGESTLNLGEANGERIELENPPLLVDGLLFVPADFLNRVADMRVNWNRAEKRLDLETDR